MASYILNGVLAIVVLICLCRNCGGGSKEVNKITSAVIEQENARLPLTIQKLPGVTDISIDSMVVTNNVEPYSAYLVTTWSFNEKPGEVVYVPVDSITIKRSKVSWKNINWVEVGFAHAVKML